MSKNVAVFVDVANIFYAAKAAGIDIDYVTLLKSATAGRDFVRAYAYTGLDPENENQRQFHAFLARSGYKVVSKDIRKYGDGRIKANLDIELVVDLMRMGEKLDVAVVISGDGDFAPAIAAVQQMGVRVEVISFRGNTSSDLIDVADVFIDITTVAKVEKGVRSGRRVASVGDLSMTEVPDKESGVVPRRRRRRGETDDMVDKPERAPRRPRTVRAAAAATSVESPVPDPVGSTRPIAASLVALPGEKLSRGAEVPAAVPEIEIEAETVETSVPGEAQSSDDGRRRRRRRGGRGRGRGGRADEGAEGSSEGSPEEIDDDVAAVSALPDEIPTLPQHSGFGSVWDSQIGVPAETATSRPAQTTASPDGEEFDDEPEVPEYLLSEKRQGGRGGRDSRSGRSGRNRGGSPGGYRSAIDRERYGSGSGSSFSRGSGNRGGRGPSMGTPRASARSMDPIEQTPGGDPWSEVPPEVQALLKAELARREAGAAKPKPSAPAEASTQATETAAAPKKPTRRTTRKPAAATEAPAEASTQATETAAAPKKPTRRTTRKPAAATEAPAEASTQATETAAAPKKPTRRTTRKPAAATEAPAEASTQATETAAAPKKPTRRTTRKPAAATEAPAEDA